MVYIQDCLNCLDLQYRLVNPLVNTNPISAPLSNRVAIGAVARRRAILVGSSCSGRPSADGRVIVYKEV